MQTPNLECKDCGAKYYSASPKFHKDTPCQYCPGLVKEKEDGTSTTARG